MNHIKRQDQHLKTLATLTASILKTDPNYLNRKMFDAMEAGYTDEAKADRLGFLTKLKKALSK